MRGDRSAKTDDAEKPGEATYCGILTSVRSGQSEMFVNADTILTSFYEAGPLLNYIEALLGRPLVEHPQLREAEIKHLNTNLLGFKVFLKHLRYASSRKIKQITKKGADEIKVTEAQTVAKYFKDTYKELDHPSLPCVEVESKKGKCYYPLEMCFIPLGQRGEQSQSGKPLKPSDRFSRAKGVARELAERREDTLGELVTSIETSPVKFNAKQLPSYHAYVELNQDPPMESVSWRIVNMVNESVQHSAHILKNNLVARGMEQNIRLESEIQIVRHYGPDVREMLLEAQREEVKFVVIILSYKKSNHYNTIKHCAEIELGLITQCVAIPVEKYGDANIGRNIMRKIKAKLGYVDKAMPKNIDKFEFENVLVMGADVSHHSPSDQSPSVAAIVASIDDGASHYIAVIRPQEKTNGKKRVEIIQNMETMVKELFDLYKEKNPGKSPKDILFYRDGVSEGEFQKVHEKELRYLKSESKKAFKCNPRITFVTVQKRHRTRFCLANKSSGNVPPGTVVDTTITQHDNLEFFMCSHTPVRGTARPAHYRLIRDDDDKDGDVIEFDTLQKITFSLCHMYARCEAPVSIPAPVYYAHLAAARASCYMKATGQVNTNPISIVAVCRDNMFFI